MLEGLKKWMKWLITGEGASDSWPVLPESDRERYSRQTLDSMLGYSDGGGEDDSGEGGRGGGE